jgi:pimeloyl-ACP methyl ester carboxylesterase
LGRLLSTVGVLLMALVLVGYFRPIELSLFIKRAELWTQGERSHDVMVDGYRIHYREMGQGTPLLLVHGLGGNSLDWAPVMKTYAKAGYHVLAPDLLGFGKSQKPDVSYSIEEQTQLVHDFLAVENVPQADVVGWSMGGWISLKLALEHPENVHRLVVNDSAGLNFLPDYGQTLFTPESEDAVNTLLGRLEPKSKPVPRFIARDMTRRVKTETGWVIRRAVASMYSKADLLDGKLGAINQPVLIVWGADDGLIPVTSGYEMAREMPQADMQVFRNCGHMAPEICSTAVSQKTLQFLKAEDPPKGLIQQTSVVIPYWFPH